MSRLAVFDLDGTLVDSREDLCRAVNHALRSLGLPERSLDEVSSFVGEGAPLLVARALGPANAHLQAQALAAWHEHYAAHLLDTTRLYPGIAEVLSGARVPMAVHTNKPGTLARRILEGLGVLGRFVEVLGGDEAPRKPDPAGTRAILERHRARAEDSLLVGDSVIDLRLARAVPLRFVAVTWGLVAEAQLADAGADLRLSDAAQLAPWLA